MATSKDEGIADEVVDQLLAGLDPSTVFESGGLIDELKKRLAERMLDSELDHHLGNAAEEEAAHEAKAWGRNFRRTPAVSSLPSASHNKANEVSPNGNSRCNR